MNSFNQAKDEMNEFDAAILVACFCLLIAVVTGIGMLFAQQDEMFVTNILGLNGFLWVSLLSVNLLRIHDEKFHLFDFVTFVIAVIMFALTAYSTSNPETFKAVHLISILLSIILFIGNFALFIDTEKSFFGAIILGFAMEFLAIVMIYLSLVYLAAIFMTVSILILIRLIWVILKRDERIWPKRHIFIPTGIFNSPE